MDRQTGLHGGPVRKWRRCSRGFAVYDLRTGRQRVQSFGPSCGGPFWRKSSLELSDNQAYDLIHKAGEVVGKAKAETAHANYVLDFFRAIVKQCEWMLVIGENLVPQKPAPQSEASAPHSPGQTPVAPAANDHTQDIECKKRSNRRIWCL